MLFLDEYLWEQEKYSMYVCKEDIDKLLPHRSPFLFVDEIVSATEDEIIGHKTFGKECSWLMGDLSEKSFVPDVIVIESMVQCGGAGMRLLRNTTGIFALAGIESATFFKGSVFYMPITYIIKNIRLSDKLVKQSGIAYINDEIVVEATWACMRIS